MAGRDGTVTQKPVRLPNELILVLICYQNRRRLASYNAAVIELLETHPRIQEIVAEMLDAARDPSVICEPELHGR